MLTSKEKQVIDFVQDFIKTEKYNPSIKQIANGLNKHRTTISKITTNLAERNIFSKTHKVIQILQTPSQVMQSEKMNDN